MAHFPDNDVESSDDEPLDDGEDEVAEYVRPSTRTDAILATNVRNRVLDQLHTVLTYLNLFVVGTVFLPPAERSALDRVEFTIRLVWARESWQESWQRIQEYVVANSDGYIRRLYGLPPAHAHATADHDNMRYG